MIKGNRYVSIRVNFLFFPDRWRWRWLAKLSAAVAPPWADDSHFTTEGEAASLPPSRRRRRRRHVAASSQTLNRRPRRHSPLGQMCGNQSGSTLREENLVEGKKIISFSSPERSPLSTFDFLSISNRGSFLTATRHYLRTYSYVLDVFNESLSR